MGLFNFKKKKEMPSPSEPSEKPEIEEVAAFDKMISDAPPLPLELKKPEVPLSKQKEQPTKQMPSPHEKGLQSFEPSPVSKQMPQAPTPQAEEGFELPDFNEQEIKELERLKHMDKPIEKKPEPVKPESVKPIPTIYPKPPEPLVTDRREKFTDIKNYIHIKEYLDKARTLTSSIGRMIEQHAATSKEKEDKYNALIESLNTIQEKMILIDNKLFENP